MGVVNMSINRGYGVFSGMDGKTREHATKLLRARRIPPPERVEVPCARLDTLMARAKLPTRVNFLSLDVEGAELEVLDMWIERRLRRSTVDAYLERMRVVAGHLGQGMDPADLEQNLAALRVKMEHAAGPRGFEYEFCKLFAIARRPA